MKKKDIIEKLIELLKNIKQHDKFLDELYDIIAGKSGCEKDLFSELQTQLKMIYALGISIKDYNGNEILSGAGGIYSIHLKKGSKYNIRILIKFKNNQSRPIPYFLTAFEEIGRGRKDKNGYSKNIKIAEERFKEMELREI